MRQYRSLILDLEFVPPKTTHHDKEIGWKFGKGGIKIPFFRDTANLTAAKAEIDRAILQEGKPPAEPLTGPLRVSLTFTWPYLSNAPKRVTEPGDTILKDTKPDCDNLSKTFLDRLSALRFIGNDAEVAVLHIVKQWGPRAGIIAHIEEVPS